MIDYGEESKTRAEAVRAAIAAKPPRKIKTPKLLAVIDQSGCTGCEACIQFCPVDCIELVPGAKFPDLNKVVEVDLDRCIGCKMCAKYCPWTTIHMVSKEVAEQNANEWTLRSVIDPLKVTAEETHQIWPRPADAPAPESSSEPATSDQN